MTPRTASRPHAHSSAPKGLSVLLSGLVPELGLAGEASFVAAEGGRSAPPIGDGEHGRLVPVTRPDGRVEGHLRCRSNDPAVLRRLHLLADFAGAAFGEAARARALADREGNIRRVAEQLQDSLLPPLPILASTSMAVRYRAAAREARVGGDFYDVFPLPNGLALIVVGDVMGKGVQAASRTSRITQTIRALTMQGLELQCLLARVDEQVSFQDPEILATLWCGIYDPDTGELTFASRGHPPALLVRADGNALRLEAEGLPLGMSDLAESPPEVRTRRLEPRDLLVVYTDGVIEASGDVIAGTQALIDICERHRQEPLSGVVDRALDELLADAGYADDAVMLLLRRR